MQPRFPRIFRRDISSRTTGKESVNAAPLPIIRITRSALLPDLIKRARVPMRVLAASRQKPRQVRSRAAGRHLCNFSGRPGGNDVSALVARSGTDVDDPIAARDHLHIMLHHNHGIAGLEPARRVAR